MRGLGSGVRGGSVPSSFFFRSEINNCTEFGQDIYNYHKKNFADSDSESEIQDTASLRDLVRIRKR